VTDMARNFPVTKFRKIFLEKFIQLNFTIVNPR